MNKAYELWAAAMNPTLDKMLNNYTKFSMSVPQPFQYQGSKRGLASLILQYFPSNTVRLVEPFCGSAAISIATAVRSRAREFWLNDFNKPLAELLSLIH